MRVELPGGLPAPRLGLGTFQLEGRECRRVVEAALALGYRHVDTAEGYGNERAVGEAIRRSAASADEVFVVSKVWRDHLRPAALRERLHGTLRRLGIGTLDLYLIHWPNSRIPPEDTVGELERLREAGKIRGWGVSNFTSTHLDGFLPLGPVASNQVEVHPYFSQEKLVGYCRDRQVPVTAYSPLARGRVTRDPVLREIGAARGRSAAAVALRWVLQRVEMAVPKASSEEHLRDNLEALEFSLSAEEMAAVDARPQGERLFDYEWSEFDR